MNVRTAVATIAVGMLLGSGGLAASGAAQNSVRAFSCPASAKPAKLNFSLKDLNNAPVSLASFKGKVVILDFWATWCGPCKVEIPWFVEWQTKYSPKGFSVVGISTDDTLALLKPYAEKMKMNYPILQGKDHDDVMDALGPIVGMPTTLVISRAGKICATHVGLTDKQLFENEITALLAAAQ